MGLYSVLMGIGFGLAFKATGALVLGADWRTAWCTLGYILLGAVAPLCWMLARNPPKDADSVSSEEFPSRSAASGDSSEVSFRRALLTPCFWSFAIATSFYGLLSSGIGLFNQAILAERYLPTEVYHNALAMGALAGMVFNLLGGWGHRWMSFQRQLTLAMLVLSIALYWLPTVTSAAEAYANALLMSAAGGVVTVVFFSIWAERFGKRELGRIQGAAQMCTVVASAAGPEVVAFAKHQAGSYLSVYPWFAVASILMGAIVALVPVRTAESSSQP
jgi:hypothetical protein